MTRDHSRRSFLALGIGAVAGLAGWARLTHATTPDGIARPLRRMLELNETIARRLFDSGRLAPTFPAGRAGEPRVNGAEGMADALDADAWRLHVSGPGMSSVLQLAAIERLPRVEMTTELKCIEGWSVIVTWAGARFSDFAALYGPPGWPGARGRSSTPLHRYVGLATPDGGYYVGIDAESTMHPQTLLCYEMNGSRLSVDHGAPLRLVTSVKYGIKSIKRIGTIAFTERRPPDFWAERGYDWYAGL